MGGLQLLAMVGITITCACLLLSAAQYSLARPQEAPGPAPAAPDAPPAASDLVDAERVEASDGTEAFNLLVAAVNSADERVKGFEGELKQVLDKAEKSPMKGTYKK